MREGLFLNLAMSNLTFVDEGQIVDSSRIFFDLSQHMHWCIRIAASAIPCEWVLALLGHVSIPKRVTSVTTGKRHPSAWSPPFPPHHNFELGAYR